MVQTHPKLKTFEDYLAYVEGTDGFYELTNGELIEMPPESDENVIIARAMDRAGINSKREKLSWHLSNK